MTDNTRLCKCGKVGKNSCPNDDRCGTANTQLPAEVVDCIINWVITFSLAYHKSKNKDISNDAAEYITDELGMPNSLTEYATKLQKANLDRLNLKMTIKGIEDQLTVERAKHNAARAILQQARDSRSLHNVKDYELLTEINTFLDGTK